MRAIRIDLIGQATRLVVEADVAPSDAARAASALALSLDGSKVPLPELGPEFSFRVMPLGACVLCCISRGFNDCVTFGVAAEGDGTCGEKLWEYLHTTLHGQNSSFEADPMPELPWCSTVHLAKSPDPASPLGPWLDEFIVAVAWAWIARHRGGLAP